MRISDHASFDREGRFGGPSTRKGLTVRFGDSLDDVVHYLRTTPRTWELHHALDSNHGYQWTFDLRYEDALQLALKGWPDGTDRLAAGVKAVPAPQAAHHKRMHDVGGDYADIGRYLSGMPDSMIRRGRQTGIKPVIHMVIHPMTMSTVTAYEFLTMGTAMALVIDQLEASGRRVELDVAFLRMLPNKWSLEGWKLKRADDHLDFGALAFSLAHPASSRRIAFGLRERTTRAQQDHGYGSAMEITTEHLQLIDADDALCVNMSYASCKDTRSAVRSLTSIINSAAGEVIVEADYR